VSVLLWVIAALALIAVELLSLDLILLMLAGGALGAAVTALAGGPPLLQALVAAILSVVLLGFVRPLAIRHLQVPRHTKTGAEALVGTHGIVLEPVDALDGRVKLGGEIWSAKSTGKDKVYEVGATVNVVRIDGAHAVVEADVKSPSQIPPVPPSNASPPTNVIPPKATE
jgi:membrane protein implicated in regulation of membrane protease activity